MVEENMEISGKNRQQLPKPQCTFVSNMLEVTIQNNLDPVYMWYKTQFQFKIVIGRLTVIENLFIYFVKKENLLKVR